MGRQDSPLLTAANLGFLLSPFAKAVTVGGIAWQVKNDAVKVGTVEVSTAISELAPFYLRMSVNRHAPSEPRLQYLVSEKPKAFSARRLCVNAPHRPFSGTHKHLVEPGGWPRGCVRTR